MQIRHALDVNLVLHALGANLTSHAPGTTAGVRPPGNTYRKLGVYDRQGLIDVVAGETDTGRGV